MLFFVIYLFFCTTYITFAHCKRQNVVCKPKIPQTRTMEQNFELIAKTFMGLEPVLAKELTQLGANDVWCRFQETKN